MTKEETLETLLQVGAKIRIGKLYAENSALFKEGEIITLIEGEFEYDNGLYGSVEYCPAVWNEEGKEFESIYHLFGNDLEDFKDCAIVL